MQDFEYHSPESLSEACKLMKEYKGTAQILAGGTDLIPNMYNKKYAPAHIINLKRVSELDEISYDRKNGLTIGPLVKLNDLIYSDIIRSNYPILRDVAKNMASHQIRNLATVGGNLCNAAPSADTAPILIALDSVAIITGPNDINHNLPLGQFFTGPGITVLKSGEILTGIKIPPIEPRTGMAYIKHSTRQALEIAVVGVAGLIRLESSNDKCSNARIVIAACAPTPLRVPAAEDLLIGKKPTEEALALAAKTASVAVKPITDVRACEAYRREMVRVQCKRMLEKALSATSSKPVSDK
jgi:carbon-monoxide dehydrogenase medium subunit